MITFSQLGRYGRFGNMLFQVAGTIGLAIKHGYAYAFPKFINHDHLERFGSQEDIDLQKYFLYRLPTTDASLPDFAIPWGHHPNLKIPDNVSISGHLQSDKYFAHCKIVIQQIFHMKNEPAQNDAVAIHWRLGDYDDQYHTRLKLDYYLNAIRHIPKADKAIIFTDDKAAGAGLAIRIQEDIGIDAELSTLPSYVDDFRLMKTCKHFITGNSSFSLMAAILGRHPEKVIICPKKWFGPAWSIPMETKDLYPEGAIIL